MDLAVKARGRGRVTDLEVLNLCARLCQGSLLGSGSSRSRRFVAAVSIKQVVVTVGGRGRVVVGVLRDGQAGRPPLPDAPLPRPLHNLCSVLYERPIRGVPA